MSSIFLSIFPVCLTSEKTQVNNSRSSQSHQVTRSFPCLVAEGLMWVWVCICTCYYQQRWDYSLVWKRSECSNKERPILSLSIYWLSLGWSQSVWQTECEAVCTTKVSVSVRSGHQLVCLMSLTLALTLSGGSLRGNAHSTAFKDRVFHAVNQTALHCDIL